MKGVDLLNKRVVVRGIELGRVIDVIVEDATERPLGLVVRCGDGEDRFLPLAIAKVGGEDVEVDSPLALLETDQLAFYRSRGRALRSTH
jgi:hypothetical protein